MKLRTRIALLAGIVVFLATLLGDAAIFRVCRRALLERSRLAVEVETQSLMQSFDAYCEKLGDRPTAEQAAYFFRSRRDDYSILMIDGAAVYNQTVLDPGELLTSYTEHSILTENASQYFRMRQSGRPLLVCVAQASVWNTTLVFHIADETDVFLEVYGLAGQIALISLMAFLLAAALLLLVLRRALKPLTALSESANAIAAGAYDRRVPAGRKDEIGALGRDFNRMADAVERHIREVEESEEKKTLFMGGLTHELKTPLTAISGYAQTLRTVKLSAEDEAEALKYIVEESRRLDRLSKKMMRLLELEHNAELRFEHIPAAELFEAARRTVSASASEKGVRIEIGAAEGDLYADRDLMQEVLVNLLDNAVKASKPGDAVRLFAENGCMTVEDAGCGIPPEELGRITEPFYMVDKSRSRKSGGAGLGLTLTAMILRRHGMALRVESEPGKGTRMTVFKEKA